VLDAAATARIRAEIAMALGTGVDVELVEHDRLEPLASGKHRFVVALPESAAPAGRS